MTTLPLSAVETLRRVLISQAADVHTSLPGIVEAYDPAAQTVDVRPAVKRTLSALNEDSEDLREALPLLRSVPVAWPRGGGFYLHFPLAVGDSVLLVFCESDIGQWRHSGEVSDPGLDARHGLSGAVAVPGVYPRNASVGDASGAYGRIGSDGGAFVEFRPSEIRAGGPDSVALSKGLDAIHAAITGAAVVANDGGAALKANILAALALDVNWSDRAAGELKA